MNNNIKVFESKEFGEIRTVTIDSEPWFVGKDVAMALGYAKPENAIATHVDEEDKTTTLIQGTGSNYKSKTVIINESGLYSLIMSSKLSNAKAFKRWVTSEVLPSIRKHGGYITGQEQMSDDELVRRALLVVHSQFEAREKELAQMKEENKALVGEELTWADRTFILKTIKSLGYALHDYAAAWNLFKQELLYKHHINLNGRKKPANGQVLDKLEDDEMTVAVQSIMALCTEHGVDLTNVIEKNDTAKAI